jgi:putative addiction module component (TIGR02574 family)
MAESFPKCYFTGMTPAEIKLLPIDQKFQIMESIWADLHEQIQGMEISQSVKNLLDQRRASVESGESKLLEWDDVKSTIGRR